jgi:hypothetical protein
MRRSTRQSGFLNFDLGESRGAPPKFAMSRSIVNTYGRGIFE